MNKSTTYKTKQKNLILNCLIKYKNQHITVDEIMRDLNKESTVVGRTTVYRHLEKMVEQGIIRKYLIEEGKSACYQYMDGNNDCKEHFHLKCVNCGKLMHVDCDYLNGINGHVATHHGFQIDHSKTVLYGCCSACKSKD
jgi:Fur family ferric uptake transcriptional regulator